MIVDPVQELGNRISCLGQMGIKEEVSFLFLTKLLRHHSSKTKHLQVVNW